MFTLPHELNPLILINKKALFIISLKPSGKRLLILRTRLGGQSV